MSWRHCSPAPELPSVESFRRALEIDPRYDPAHYNLGRAFEDQGHLDRALESYRNALAIWSTLDDAFSVHWAGRARARIDALTDTLQQLPSLHLIISGEAQGSSPHEWIQAAELAAMQGDTIGSARVYEQCFAAFPDSFAEAGHAYNALCMAALAGTGHGEGAADLAPSASSALRAQARDWLRADLARCVREAGTGSDQRAEAIRHLRWAQTDSDLAPVRETEALNALPEDEVAKWQVLWNEVAGALEQLARE